MDSNNLIEQLLNNISPEESIRIENRMLLAAKIEDALKAKGWKKKDLMVALGKKNQSEATKWLSGTHNFTSDLLSDLGRVLGVSFLNIDKINSPVVETHYRVLPVIVTVKRSQFSFINEMVSAKTVYDKSVSTQFKSMN